MRKSFKTGIDQIFRNLMAGERVELWFEMDGETIKSRASRICDSENDKPLEKEIPFVEDAIVIAED